uniref:HAT C-terminal dimerisation domain-containing protein n=1 Tax=Iconisemion striatum TaxID=60296 RepID=A0A1A7WLH5_9TELE
MTFIGLGFIKSHLKVQPVVHPGDTSFSSEEEDFFCTIRQGNVQENSKQLESYLACPSDSMDVLKSFPAVSNLSLKLNTPLPASAACERLFSTAGLIFRPKRARVDAKNFENQLLMKLNKRFI